MAVSEPKMARQTFCQLVVGSPETLNGFLELASRPGESRLRHVVAAAMRLDLPELDLGSWLRQPTGLRQERRFSNCSPNEMHIPFRWCW